MPNASAQCTCANVGGLDMIASAAKVRPLRGHGAWHASQHPSIISVNIFRFFAMSPLVRESNPGTNPGSE